MTLVSLIVHVLLRIVIQQTQKVFYWSLKTLRFYSNYCVQHILVNKNDADFPVGSSHWLISPGLFASNAISQLPGGYSQKNWLGVCGPFLRTLTLFMTKICDILYPIYDLTKNSKPYLWPDPYIKILFQTCIIMLNCRKRNLWRVFVDFLFHNDEKLASS